MKKRLQWLDSLIEKIPPHIRDIIQKAFFAVFALIALIAVSVSVMHGLRDARPEGMQVAKDSQDLFYMEMLRSQNEEKLKLLEDVPVDANDFPSRTQAQSSDFLPLGADRSQRLMGEKEEFYNEQKNLRRDEKNISPMLLPPTESTTESNRQSAATNENLVGSGLQPFVQTESLTQKTSRTQTQVDVQTARQLPTEGKNQKLSFWE